MPSRKLPTTHTTRLKALKTAKSRKDAVPPPLIIPLTAPTITRLDLFYPAFKLKVEAMEAALNAQTAATELVKTNKRLAELYISHFYQAFQNAIARGEMAASVRTLYGLDANDGSAPVFNTEDDIDFWGDKAAIGEAARIAAGGTAIALPAIAQVTTAVTNFTTANNAQGNAKEAYDMAQEAVEADLAEADKLILKMWNEIEAAFDTGDAPSKRRKAREWGVTYLIAVGENPDPAEFSFMGTVTDGNGNPIEDAAVEVQQTGEIVLTNAQGKYFIPLQPPGNYTLNYHKAGHVDQQRTNQTAAPGIITEINVILLAFGAVSGALTNTGIPAAGSVTINGTGLTINTGGDGLFNFTEVEPGDYVVSAFLNSNPANIKTQNVTVISGGSVVVNFSFP